MALRCRPLRGLGLPMATGPRADARGYALSALSGRFTRLRHGSAAVAAAAHSLGRQPEDRGDASDQSPEGATWERVNITTIRKLFFDRSFADFGSRPYAHKERNTARSGRLHL